MSSFKNWIIFSAYYYLSTRQRSEFAYIATFLILRYPKPILCLRIWRKFGSLIFILYSFSAVSYIICAFHIGLLFSSISSAMLWTFSWISNLLVSSSSSFVSVLLSFFSEEQIRPTRPTEILNLLATSAYNSYSTRCACMMSRRSLTESYFKHRFLYLPKGNLSKVSKRFLSHSLKPSLLRLRVE